MDQVRFFQIEHLAHEREPVGVDSAGRKRDHDVSLSHPCIVDDLAFIYNACDISCQVVFIFRIESCTSLIVIVFSVDFYAVI